MTLESPKAKAQTILRLVEALYRNPPPAKANAVQTLLEYMIVTEPDKPFAEYIDALEQQYLIVRKPMTEINLNDLTNSVRAAKQLEEAS